MEASRRQIGIVSGWSGDKVSIIIMDPGYVPGLGDILYTHTGSSIMLLQVSGFKGELPVASQSILSMTRGDVPVSYSLQKVMVVEATPFFEIRSIRSRGVVVKPTSPPPLESPVYRLAPSDPEAVGIMKKLSEGIRPSVMTGEPDYIPVAWLRSGIAASEELRGEKYFSQAPLEMDLARSIPKHILVAGQTGAGKTTSVMGMIIAWALHGRERMGWLIIDRHGEYSVYTSETGFMRILEDSLETNKELIERGLRAYVYSITVEQKASNSGGDIVSITTSPMTIRGISVYDAGMALGLSQERISDLEEVAGILSSLIRSSQLPENWKNVFIDGDEPTGNMLALIPLLVDNVFNHEGVGEREKKGLYRIMVNAGIDIRRLRMFRRLILSLFGLSRRYATIQTSRGRVSVAVLDDGSSAFKVSPLLKHAGSLVRVMSSLLEAARNNYNVALARYPWDLARGVSDRQEYVSATESAGVGIDEIVDRALSGNIVVLDVSKIPVMQGDAIVMSVLRRIFERRMGMGVDAIRDAPTIAIVSEEAPLYLSPESVRSPYNIFARIAREGRKFRIGLIAITQLATQIESQILANFNTIIALRTKYTSDISYYRGIGVPGETLPTLGDREGYLYTPDLKVKEPIPVYIPGFYEYRSIVDRRRGEMRRREEAKKEILRRGLSLIAEEDEEP